MLHDAAVVIAENLISGNDSDSGQSYTALNSYKIVGLHGRDTQISNLNNKAQS